MIKTKCPMCEGIMEVSEDMDMYKVGDLTAYLYVCRHCTTPSFVFLDGSGDISIPVEDINEGIKKI